MGFSVQQYIETKVIFPILIDRFFIIVIQKPKSWNKLEGHTTSCAKIIDGESDKDSGKYSNSWTCSKVRHLHCSCKPMIKGGLYFFFQAHSTSLSMIMSGQTELSWNLITVNLTYKLMATTDL